MRLFPSIALLRTQSDARLVSLACEGHEPAFTALVERYRRPVLIACRSVLPEARAEDAAQQTFVAAWKALGRGDDVREVRPWLMRIARNTSLNALRVQGFDYDELSGALQGGEAPQSELERREVMRQTLAGLAALPDNQREALLRSAVQGASHADIARDLGLSEGATRQLVLRARTTLRGAVTAVTPLPLVQWAVRAGETAGTETAVRIAEVASAGGAAGASALLAKAGVVAVVAGGAVATPAVVNRGGDGPDRQRTTATAAQERGTPAPTAPTTTSTPAPARTPAVAGRAGAGAAAPSRSAIRRRATPDGPGRRDRPGRRADRAPARDGGDAATGPAPVTVPAPTAAPTATPQPSPEPAGGKGRGRGRGRGGDEDDDAVAIPTPAPAPAATAVPDGDHSDKGRGRGRGGDDEDDDVEEQVVAPTPTPAPTVKPDSAGRGNAEDRGDDGDEDVDED